MQQKNQQEGRQKDADSRQDGTRDALNQIANKSRRREDRAWGELADRNGIQQLCAGQRSIALDEFSL